MFIASGVMVPPSFSASRRFLWLLLVNLCAAGSVPNSDSELEKWFGLHDSSTSASDGAFEDWLSKLKVTVPDGTIPPIETDVRILLVNVHLTVQIHEIVCEGINIGALDSRPEQRDAASAVTASAQRVALSCAASVDYKTSLLGMSGTATGRLHTADASVSLGLRMPRWNSTRDIGNTSFVLLESCKCSPELTLEITGGTFWTKFAEYLPAVLSSLQDLVNSQLSAYVCTSAVGDAVLELNELINKTLEEESRGNQSRPHELWNESWVALDRQPLAAAVALTQENFMSPYDVCDRFLGDRCLVGAEVTCLHAPVCLVDNKTGCLSPGIIPSEPAAGVGLHMHSVMWHSHRLNITPFVFANATISTSASAEEFSVQAAFHVNFSDRQGESAIGGNVLEDMDISEVLLNITFENVEVATSMTLGLDSATFQRVPSYRYFVARCIAPAIREMDVINVSASFFIKNLSLQPVSPSSVSSKTLFHDILKLACDVVAGLFGAGDLATTLLAGFAQNELADTLSSGLRNWMQKHRNDVCPPPRGEEKYFATGKQLIRPVLGRSFCLLALGIVTLAFGAALYCRFRPCEGQRGQGWRAQYLGDTLCMSPVVPRPVAIFVPLSILAATFFLMGANYLLFAETYVNLEAGARKHPDFVLSAYQVMVYSILYSVETLYYEARLETLSWIIFCFSLVLPYVKLFFMMFGWIAPQRLLPPKARGLILVVMDEVGKFSLIDIFAVQYISGVFHLEFAGKSETEAAEMRIVLRTSEEVGFAAFVSATISSLFIGHACRYYHEQSQKSLSRPAVQPSNLELGREDVSAGQLDVSLVPTRDGNGEVASPADCRQQHIIGVCLLIDLLLCVLGCLLPAFTVSLDSPPLAKLGSSSYSVFSFAYDLRSFSAYPEAFPTIFNQATFVIFAIGTIVVHLSLLILLCFRMAPQLQFASTLAHCLGAWSALDVALLSLVVTLQEMEQSDFVRLDDPSKATLSRILGKEVTTDHGLLVKANLESGTYVLIAAALGHLVLSRVALLCLKA
eukprot:TRINITY_DN40970_c0_g1_i1.p1 TRINITY_DN40970_c0_g1~~TRINITY_DN40970_c0_g1_i1.p1  ORF type:complete len:1025 (-),score=162.90 TRINITY_DN40970_c0_g1_i1:41-3115(-)